MDISFKKLLKWFIIVTILPASVIGVSIYNNWKSLRLAREKSIGEYTLSLDRSNVKLTTKDSLQLVSLKLTLKSDGKFKFSQSVAYFEDTFGSWEVDGYGMDQYIVLKMPNGRIYQLDTCCSHDNTISMVYPSLDQSRKFGSIAFLKLNTGKGE